MTERVGTPALHPRSADRRPRGVPVRTLDRVPAGAAELEVDVRGSGDAIVFIHGLGVADTFAPVVERLACAGTDRLIRYRRRGYGGSGPRRGRCTSIEEHAADCVALLAALGVARAHVVGHSYGGCVALQAALDHPEVVSSLVLLEPAVSASPTRDPCGASWVASSPCTWPVTTPRRSTPSGRSWGVPTGGRT